MLTGCTNAGLNEAESSYRAGVGLQVQGKFEEAIASYSEAIEHDPELAVAYIARADVYNRLGEYKKSIEDLDKAIGLELGLASAYYLRRSAYNQLDQSALPAVEEFNEALEEVSEVIELARAFASRGAANIRLGDENAAIQDLNKAIDLDPRYSLAYFHRALAYSELGRPETAIQDLDKAIQLDPQNADTFAANYRIAFVYAVNGQLRSVIQMQLLHQSSHVGAHCIF